MRERGRLGHQRRRNGGHERLPGGPALSRNATNECLPRARRNSWEAARDASSPAGPTVIQLSGGGARAVERYLADVGIPAARLGT
jgi:hypothetical protein